MTIPAFALNMNFEDVLQRGGLFRITHIEMHGPSGILVKFRDLMGDTGSIIVSQADNLEDGIEYLHASIAYDDQSHMPSYTDLKILHMAVFGRKRWSYQIFAPESDNVNIRSNALHLWGRADGKPCLPNFGQAGTI